RIGERPMPEIAQQRRDADPGRCLCALLQELTPRWVILIRVGCFVHYVARLDRFFRFHSQAPFTASFAIRSCTRLTAYTDRPDNSGWARAQPNSSRGVSTQTQCKSLPRLDGSLSERFAGCPSTGHWSSVP